MIADTETLRAGLAALFARLATIPVANCEEEAVAKKQPGPLGVKLLWSLTDRDTIGQDEILSYYDEDLEIEGDEYAGPGAPLGGVVYEARTNVVYLLEVRVECSKVNTGARTYLERLRNKINLPSAQMELAALGLAVASVGPAFDATFDDETGHAVTAWVTEIELNSSTTEADDPITTIETAELEVTPEP